MALNKQSVSPATVITSHINADFDATAAMLAAHKLYPDSVIVFPGSQEKNLRDFFIRSTSYLFNMADPGTVDFSQVDRLILVDTRQPGRLAHVAPLLEKNNIEICIYDHHPAMTGDVKGDLEIIEPLGSTTTILCGLLQEKNCIPTAEEATIMALGIYEDTGLFTYSSTTARDLEMAAFLLSCGASLETIVQMVVKEIKSEQVTWLNEMLNEMTVHKINGLDVHLSVISSPQYITDLASIVQKVVRMENLDIFFAVVLMGNKINIVARNSLPQVDAGRILSAFGGGGHAYAASAKVDNQTLAQVEYQLVEQLQKQVQATRIAKKLMSSPAITIQANRSCLEAGAKMTRYNINTLLVVEETGGRYLGYISRQIIEKALFHKLSGLPVSDYMNPGGGSVSPEADIREIEQIVIDREQRILPVIEKDWIRGVITRTDLLNYLVQHSKAVKDSDNKTAQHRNAKHRHIANVLSQRLDRHVTELLERFGHVGEDLGVSVFVVGGFVRDLMLNRPIDDIDIVVEGDGIHFARAYAGLYGCRVNTHKKFGTAVIVHPDHFKVDVASARLEYYQTPAALPIVEKSSIKRDLARRDFTINTLAVSLNPDSFGTMTDYFGAMRDLKDKTIRTIHNLSFVEDPTRIFRAIKFSNRFQFRIGRVTDGLIKNAIRIDSFKNLSGLRVLNELNQILEEDNPIPAIRSMADYGLEKVIHPELTVSPSTYSLLESVNKVLSWHDLLYLDQAYPRWSVYFMAVIHRCSFRVTREICRRLNVPLKEQGIFHATRLKAEKKLRLIESARTYTVEDVYWQLINFKPEYILYMMALAKKQTVKKDIGTFYTRHREIKPFIRGKDLLGMGYTPGPVFSSVLRKVINAKLQGRLKTKKEELNFVRSFGQDHGLIPAE